MQVHRDIMDGRFRVAPLRRASSRLISPEARVEEGVTIEGPCFIDAGVVIKAGADRSAYRHRRQC